MPVFILLCFVFLSSCTTHEPTMPDNAMSYPNADSQDFLRYPMNGSHITKERVLYHLNQPAVMQSFQEWNRQQIRASARGETRDETLLQDMPKQRSPFRQ